jgi:RNA polymerase sigma factor (sigma-70 family)
MSTFATIAHSKYNDIRAYLTFGAGSKAQMSFVFIKKTNNPPANLAHAEKVLAEHGDFVRRILRFHVRNQVEREDLFQDFFLELISRPIPEDVQNVRGYIYHLVCDNIKDAFRRIERYQMRLHRYAERRRGIIDDLPENDLIETEEIEKMFDLIHRHLPKNEAEAMEQRYKHNCNINETAAKMGVKPKSVSRYLSAGAKKLRQVLSTSERKAHMVAPENNSICEQARAFYYDYLLAPSRKDNSSEVFAHICSCSFCKAEVDRLKVELKETEDDVVRSVKESASIAITNLKLHFGYMGEMVNCETVKPFLPGLADPALEVSVPTPITVHLDKCQQCSGDLEEIRRLKLTHKQLCRLGQLFAEEFSADEELCTKAQTVISDVGDCTFKGTSVDTLRHCCVCPDCRDLLHKYRQSKVEELSNLSCLQEIPCETVSDSDIFDYVIPYGVRPDKDEYAIFRPSLTSHLSNCPRCLRKMVDLYNTVYGILQRAESGIITCFKVDGTTRDSIVSSSEDIYRDWPIDVQVFEQGKETAPTVAFPVQSESELKQTRLHGRARRFMKPAAAAAAILIVVLLGVYGSIAKAVDLDRIYEALKHIRDVHITTYAPEQPEPAQEVWVSTELNAKMFKTGLQYVLWDLTDKTVKSKDSGTDSVTTAQISEYTLGEVRSTMDVPWGLLPFDNIAAVPQHAQWGRVDDESIEISITDTVIYDLIWTEKTLRGSTTHKKWRGYLDAETKLPKRIERWEKLPEEEVYELSTVTEVAYPKTEDIQTAIGDAGLYVSSALIREP